MAKWIIDPQHSDVHFKTRYMLISSVTGEFKNFEGTVESKGDDFTDATITFSADTDSVYTNNAQRDLHLKEEDFFHVAKHPKMTFTSTGFYHSDSEEFLLRGDLTIKTGSRPVALKVTNGGRAVDAQGRERAGFELSGSINRYEFGLVWALLTEAGGLLLGEEVKIHANIQLVKVSE
jgi:polyisoprenoid-binding protein YceI